jgi:hypothetical protein
MPTADDACRGKGRRDPLCRKCRRAEPTAKYDPHNKVSLCNTCWGDTPPFKDLSDLPE